MVKVEMFCNIDGHHLISEFRRDPHLQGSQGTALEVLPEVEEGKE
jgi:hypothetical protein